MKDALVHVSGHSGRRDIAKLYEFLKPKIAVPVHGEAAHLYEHADLAAGCGVKKTVIIKDGDVLRLDGRQPEIIGEVKTGVLARDRKQIIPLNAGVLKQRRRMIDDGTVVATLVLDKKGPVVGDVQFSAVGLIENADPVMGQMDTAVKQAVELLGKDKRLDDQSVADTVKSAVRKVVMETHGRRPLVETHLVRI